MFTVASAFVSLVLACLFLLFLYLLFGLSFRLLLHARHYFCHWRQSGSRRSKAIRNLSLGNNLLLISSGILRIDLFSILLVMFLPGLSSRVWSDAMSWNLCIWFRCGFAQCLSHPQLLFQDLRSWCYALRKPSARMSAQHSCLVAIVLSSKVSRRFLKIHSNSEDAIANKILDHALLM